MDLKCPITWTPCTNHNQLKRFPLLNIISAEAEFLMLEDGRRLIDSTSSWWCKSFGHGHPRLMRALREQTKHYEHVIAAHSSNPVTEALSLQLCKLSEPMSHVFYASDGACAVEIAMKMSLHSRFIAGDSHRKGFIALNNSYHGETGLALSVTSVDSFRRPYQDVLYPCHFIQDIPYLQSSKQALWNDCSQQWQHIEIQLEKYKETATAILVEPIIQASAGMLMFSQDLLKHLRKWSIANNIHLIADECMTGLGRLGKPLGIDYAGINPDFICLSKGLTAGVLPISAVLTTNTIYQFFENEEQYPFLHSHTYGGNALAARVALECLALLNQEGMYQRINALGENMLAHMLSIAEETGLLHNVRGIGAVVAADINKANINADDRLVLFKHAVELGAYLRPCGNSIYWTPPFNCSQESIEHLAEITKMALIKSLRRH